MVNAAKPDPNAVHVIQIIWNPTSGALSVPQWPRDSVIAFGMLEAAKRSQLLRDSAELTKRLVHDLARAAVAEAGGGEPGGVKVAGAAELQHLGDGKMRLVPP